MSNNILGRLPNQIPRNRDLGSLAFQNANRVNIKSATIDTVVADKPILDQNSLRLDDISLVSPSLVLDFANESLDGRITFTRASSATRTNRFGYIENVASGAPRFDYDPITKLCKGLLVEEARTNMVVKSNDISSASWGKTQSTVETSTTVLNPDGVTYANKLCANTVANYHSVGQSTVVTVASTVYSFSFYAKKAEYRYAFVSFSGPHQYQMFDLNSGSVGPLVSGFSSASMEDVGNGWYRCICKITATTTTTYPLIYTSPTTTANVAGTAGSGIYVWGIQMEAAVNPSSLIITDAAAATRVVEDLSMPLADAIEKASGSITVSYASRIPYSTTVNGYVGMLWGGATAFVLLKGSGTYGLGDNVAVRESSGYTADIGAQKPQNVTTKVSARLATNNMAVCIAGSLVGTDTATVMPPWTTFYIGGTSGAAERLNGHIQYIKIYPVGLSNAALAGITL